MAQNTRRRCKVCKAHDSDVGAISWAGYCTVCGLARLEENVRGISEHRGPAFLRWRRAMAASVGGVLLDDVTDAS